ncbi:hypothetical protein TRIHO_18430 [Tritonibacter horizontis]|uniref:Uncharacterized protein n=1 Tax=Tritonibacter horizontis TaxID=1768241 RepID=A0A132BYS0_9RHOB|nr:hypothetical protein TRIHO_18430 [Tritonibacter horizontis]
MGFGENPPLYNGGQSRYSVQNGQGISPLKSSQDRI